jgi:hypothetical protein
MPDYSARMDKPICTRLGILMPWNQTGFRKLKALKTSLSSSPVEDVSCSPESKHNTKTVLRPIYYPLLLGVGAEGDPFTVTIYSPLCIPIWFLIVSDLSTRALQQLLSEASNGEAGETWQRNGRWILTMKYLFHTCSVLQHVMKSCNIL